MDIGEHFCIFKGTEDLWTMTSNGIKLNMTPGVDEDSWAWAGQGYKTHINYIQIWNDLYARYITDVIISVIITHNFISTVVSSN